MRAVAADNSATAQSTHLRVSADIVKSSDVHPLSRGLGVGEWIEDLRDTLYWSSTARSLRRNRPAPLFDDITHSKF